MKAKASKPDAGRKPGGEGLPYKDAGSVVGAPVEQQPIGGLNEGKPVKGNPSLPSVPKK